MTVANIGGLGVPSPTGASPTAGTTGASSASSTAKSNMAKQLSTPNLFLKLLMVELQHQNPTNPTTPTSMLQQTAMLSQVEAITSMTSAMDQQRHDAQASDATSLIGKQVTAVVGAQTVTGAVSDVFLPSTGTPTLDVGGIKVPLSAITAVSAPLTLSATATTTTTGTTATPTTSTTTTA